MFSQRYFLANATESIPYYGFHNKKNNKLIRFTKINKNDKKD